MLVAANLLSRGRPAAQSEADAVIGTAVAGSPRGGQKGGIPTADAVPVTTRRHGSSRGADAPRGSGGACRRSARTDQEADARISHGSGHLKYLVVVGLVLHLSTFRRWSALACGARTCCSKQYLCPCLFYSRRLHVRAQPDRGATTSRLARVVQVVVCFLVCQFYFFVFVSYVFGPLCEANMDRDSVALGAARQPVE